MKEILSNDSMRSIAQAIEEMKAEQGESFSPENINLAELERRSGVSRGKLRCLKRNGFQDLPRATKGRKHTVTKLSGYTGIIDSLLKQGTKNSSVVLDRLHEAGFEGGVTIVKEYIAAHKHLIPAKRQQISPQGNRGRRYMTEPGEAFQMDWGFTEVLDCEGRVYRVAFEIHLNVPSDSITANNLFLRNVHVRRNQSNPVLTLSSVSDEDDTNGDSGYGLSLLFLNEVHLNRKQIFGAPRTLAVHSVDSLQIKLLFLVLIEHLTGFFEHSKHVK